ncbi:MAG TPA: hypothetical protein VI603_06240 [Saprospiraceae bacterium]|nr:hypothetical protein [Saprospiraceae bacterium]
MALEYIGLKNKVIEYKKVIANAHTYRADWNANLKDFIITEVHRMAAAADLDLSVKVQDNVGNLEAVTCSLGRSASGIFEKIDDDTNKPLIKHNGTLIYQQLFNGKVQVMISFPYIEGFGNPPPPKFIGIYRPQELKQPFLERHLEEFVKTVTAWEDFDDDEPSHQRIGFNQPQVPVE